jgi:hypothetical protein
MPSLTPCRKNTQESLDLTIFRDTDIRDSRNVAGADILLQFRQFEILELLRFFHIRTIQSVLSRCSELEVFKGFFFGYPQSRLEDLIEKRSASIRIQELPVIIDAGETHVPIRPNNGRHFNSQHKEKGGETRSTS